MGDVQSHAAGSETIEWRLSCSAVLLRTLVFAIGVLFLLYVGLCIGFELRLDWANKVPHAPPAVAIGMAPDLRGLVQTTKQGFRFAAAIVLGVVTGLVVGSALMSFFCRKLLVPRPLRIRCFTAHDPPD